MPAKVCVEFTEDGTGPGPNPDPSFRTYTATIGDGTTSSYTVTHGLGTRDVLYSLRNLSSGELDAYDVAVTTTTDNALSLVFATPPASGSVRVMVAAAAA